MKKISPCPFCGDVAKLVHEKQRVPIIDDRHIHTIKVYCMNTTCGASMKRDCLALYATIPSSLITWMINKWNTRKS